MTWCLVLSCVRRIDCMIPSVCGVSRVVCTADSIAKHTILFSSSDLADQTNASSDGAQLSSPAQPAPRQMAGHSVGGPSSLISAHRRNVFTALVDRVDDDHGHDYHLTRHKGTGMV